MTTDNFCFYLQNRLVQTSQTGGPLYSDTSPFSIPWPNLLLPILIACTREVLLMGVELLVPTSPDQLLIIYYFTKQAGGQRYNDTSTFSIPWYILQPLWS